MQHTLTLERKATGWWLIPIGEPDGRIPVGPYRNKQEAEEDRAGLERTERLFAKEEAGQMQQAVSRTKRRALVRPAVSEPAIEPGMLF